MFEPIKSMENMLVKFDLSTLEIKKQFKEDTLRSKMCALRDFCTLFGNTVTFNEQLKIFALKT